MSTDLFLLVFTVTETRQRAECGESLAERTVNLLTASHVKFTTPSPEWIFTAERSEVRKCGFSAISQFALRPEECGGAVERNAALRLHLTKLYAWIKCKVFTSLSTRWWEKHRFRPDRYGFFTHQESPLHAFVHLGKGRGVVVRAAGHVVSFWKDKREKSSERTTWSFT